jgi:glycosyltransferase involved in cell wall biosynthesis
VSSDGARASRVRRLLFVGTNSGPGGTESHLVSLAIAMADAGYDVAAAARPNDYIADALSADGRVRVFPAILEQGANRRAAADLTRICREARPDWLIGSFAREFWPLSIVGRRQRIPLALFLHIQKISRLSAPLYPWLASRFILPSNYLREWVVAKRLMPRWRTRVLYNPIDVERFRPDPLVRDAMRRRLGFAPDDVVIGFAGRFERQKGIQVLASVLEQVMEQSAVVRALWVGQGELESALDARIAASRHAARHVREPWSDLPAYLAAMDILAFPSIRRESFGRVAAEAQACGVPVVASRDGGTPETIIEGESGFLAPPGDVPAWSEALSRLVNDAPLRARMGTAGRAQAVERFSATRIAAEFARMLEPNDGRPFRDAARQAPDTPA